VAQRIIRANGYVSILFSMTTPKNASTLKWIWENAKHRLLLESDSPYQMSWENLPILYEQVATILNISLETLEVQMNHNLSEFLNGGNFLIIERSEIPSVGTKFISVFFEKIASTLIFSGIKNF
jgi:hypothetical protein